MAAWTMNTTLSFHMNLNNTESSSLVGNAVNDKDMRERGQRWSKTIVPALDLSEYLLREFPGRWAGGPLWVERRGGRHKDGVSSIVIGANDWAGAWAVDSLGRPMAAVVPGGERQREMAYRFGVNWVMYALTGNYKTDQVHVPAIIDRLGQ